MYNLVDQAKAAPLFFLPFQQVGDTVFHSAGVWEENKHLASDPRELIIPDALFGKVVVEGCPVGPGDSVDPNNDICEIRVERPGEAPSHAVR